VLNELASNVRNPAPAEKKTFYHQQLALGLLQKFSRKRPTGLFHLSTIIQTSTEAICIQVTVSQQRWTASESIEQIIFMGNRFHV